jgi:hypothetical protein
MRTIDVASNLHYEVVGAHEEEAAYLLEECLTAVNKRRNAYVESEIEDIIRSLGSHYGVNIALKLDRAC